MAKFTGFTPDEMRHAMAEYYDKGKRDCHKCGAWVGKGTRSLYCSVCKHEAFEDSEYGYQRFDFCPYCGADMR